MTTTSPRSAPPWPPRPLQPDTTSAACTANWQGQQAIPCSSCSLRPLIASRCSTTPTPMGRRHRSSPGHCGPISALPKRCWNGNPGLARERMRRHLLAEAQFLRDQAHAAQTLAPSVALVGPIGSKRAEGIARSILADVLAARLRPDDFVGSEAALMDKHACESLNPSRGDPDPGVSPHRADASRATRRVVRGAAQCRSHYRYRRELPASAGRHPRTGRRGEGGC